MSFLKQFLIFVIFVTTSVIANADANPDIWPILKEKMFKDKVIIEVDF